MFFWLWLPVLFLIFHIILISKFLIPIPISSCDPFWVEIQFACIDVSQILAMTSSPRISNPHPTRSKTVYVKIRVWDVELSTCVCGDRWHHLHFNVCLILYDFSSLFLNQSLAGKENLYVMFIYVAHLTWAIWHFPFQLSLILKVHTSKSFSSVVFRKPF